MADLFMFGRCDQVTYVLMIPKFVRMIFLENFYVITYLGLYISYHEFHQQILQLKMFFPFSRFSENQTSIFAREGDVLNIPVYRSRGMYRSIEVKWKCEINAKDDIQPISGVLKYKQVQTDFHVVEYYRRKTVRRSFR